MVIQQRVGLRSSGQYGTCKTAEGRVKGFRTIW